MDPLVFALAPDQYGPFCEVVLLVKSLRQFGGDHANRPVWLFQPDHFSAPQPNELEQLSALGVHIIPVHVPQNHQIFPFFSKLFAAAIAESYALDKAQRLAWLDADTFFLQEPGKMMLGDDSLLGYRPVMLKNISAIINKPLPPYWQMVYDQCQAAPEYLFLLTSTVDNIRVYAHVNAGCLVVRPNIGIFRTCVKNLEMLINSPQMQPFFTEDERYRIFLHQAALSGTICAKLTPANMRDLGERYNVAPFLLERFPHAALPPFKKVVSIRYDDFEWLSSSKWQTVLPANLPFSRWLKQQLAELA